MKQVVSMKNDNGEEYDIPSEHVESFRQTFPNASSTISYRTKNGDEYAIPEAQDEAFRKTFPDATPLRRYSFADGSTRDFTTPELAKFLRSKEWREGDDFKADREDFAGESQKSPGLAGAKAFAKNIVGQLGDAETIRETAEQTWSPIYKGYAYAQDLANSFVAELLGGSAKITEAVGHAVGDNAVGRALVDAGRGDQAMLRRNLPTDMLDTSGGGVVDKVLQTGKGVAGVTGEFLPAAIPGVGQAYGASIVSAGAVNRSAQIFEAATENGMDPIAANALALAGGGVDAIQNMMLMGKFKGIWGEEAKAAADAVKVGLVRRLLTDTAKTGATMGTGALLGDVADQIAGLDENGNVVAPQPYDPVRSLKKGFDGFIEGGMFHLVNAGAHSLPKAVKWVSEAPQRAAARQMEIQSSRDALDTPEGRALVWLNSPDAARRVFAARRKGEDVSRRMIKELGIPEGVAPTAADRNALGDALLKDYDAYKSWQMRQPDEVQPRTLDDTISTFSHETAKTVTREIRDKVLGKIEDARELDDPEKREKLVGEAFEEWNKEHQQEKPNETGNVPDETSARPQPSVETRAEGSKADRSVEGEPPRGETSRTGVVKPAEKPKEPPQGKQEPPEPPKTGEDTPAPAKPVETPSRASGATREEAIAKKRAEMTAKVGQEVEFKDKDHGFKGKLTEVINLMAQTHGLKNDLVPEEYYAEFSEIESKLTPEERTEYAKLMRRYVDETAKVEKSGKIGKEYDEAEKAFFDFEERVGIDGDWDNGYEINSPKPPKPKKPKKGKAEKPAQPPAAETTSPAPTAPVPDGKGKMVKPKATKPAERPAIDTTPLSDAIAEAKALAKKGEEKEFEVKVGTTTIKLKSTDKSIAVAEKMLKKLQNPTDWNKKPSSGSIPRPPSITIATGKKIGGFDDVSKGFVSKDDTRVALQKPIVQNGKIYATDGRIAIRMDAPKGAKGKKGEPNCEQLYTELEKKPPKGIFTLDVQKAHVGLEQARTIPQEAGDVVEMWLSPEGEVMFRARDNSRFQSPTEPSDAVAFVGKSLHGAQYIGAYDPAYLSTAIKAFAKLGDGKVEIEWRGEGPIRIKGKNADVLVMPMSNEGSFSREDMALLMGGKSGLTSAEAQARIEANPRLKEALKKNPAGQDPLYSVNADADLPDLSAKTPEQEINERLDLRRMDPKRRSDPKVLAWAKRNGRTVTNGMATPDAVRAYDESMTENTGRLVKRWFPDMKIVAHKFGEKIKRGQHVLEQRIDDPATIAELEKDTVSRLRSMQLRDGKLYPPMAGKVKSGETGKAEWQEPSEPGIWYRADEYPELLDKDGKFTLIKGNGEQIKAAYNPYWHMSKTALNDQFSSAYKRPELVTVEVSAPRSEAEAKRGEGYWATGAKDPVGETKWPKGPVSGQLAKAGAPKRKVTLTRHNKIVRVLPTEEVADRIKAEIDACPRKDVTVEVPFNCVTPQLRDALVERGVKIGRPARLSGAALKKANTAYKNWETSAEKKYLRDTSGRTLGWFDPNSKEVHLLPGADPKTVAHEIMWHGTRDYISQLAAKGDARAQRFLDMMHDVEKNIPEPLKKKIIAIYTKGTKAPTSDTLMNEFGAWFTMEKGGAALEKALQSAEGRNWFAKAFYTVKEMYKDFLTRHGRNRVDLSAIDGMTRDEFVDFLAKEFASGKTLGNITDKGNALSTKETKLQAYRRKAYDNNAPVRDLERDIEKKTGKKISADDSVEAANALKYGLKEAANIEIQGKMADLRKSLGESGIHYEDLEYYAALKAAEGRDAKIDKRNIDKLTEDMKKAGASAQDIADAIADYKSTNGSHIDPREAKKMIAEIENGPDAAKYKDAYDKLRAVIEETLDTQVAAGLVDAKDAAKWRAEEPNYIPFKNEYDPDSGEWAGRGTSRNFVKPEHHMAKGRQSAAGDIIAHVFMDHQSARHRAIENAVRQKLAKLVRDNPELGKVEILRPEAVKNLEADDPNVVVFKDGGRAYAIRLNGTRGAAIANAFTQRNLVKMGWADKGFEVFGKKITFRNFAHWSAGMATRHSPTFAVRNTTKDNIELANIVFSERGPVEGAKFLASYAANRVKMAKTLAKYVTTGKIDTTAQEGQILDRYVKAGGLIAGGVRAEGMDSIKAKLSPEAIAKEMKRGKSKLAATAKHVINSIDYLNEYAELATRLGVFSTEVKAGKSDAEAALFSRRATVDFNRHGDYTPAFNVFRLFSNSTLGATARAAAALGKSKYGKAAALAMFANGLAQAVIEHFYNQDEDERRRKTGEATGKDVSEFDRKTALFYFRDGDRVYKVAQHESPFSLITYAGNSIGRWLCGDMNGEDVAKNLGVSTAELAYNFLPMGSINLQSRKGGLVNDLHAAVVSGVCPSVLQPVAELAWNVDYKGDPVLRTMMNDYDPKSHNGKEHTPDWAKQSAEWLNDSTGGNAGRRGFVDIAPEAIQKLVEGYGKNALRDVSAAYSVGKAIADGDISGLDPRNTPVKRDFVRPLDGNDRRFNDALSAYKADKNEASKMKDAWTDEELSAYEDAHPWVADAEVENSVSEIQKLRKMEQGFSYQTGKATPYEWSKEEIEEFKKERRELQAFVLEKMRK